MDKKVSVIIPCYNQAKYVSEAIDSVLNQTYSNIEIIIINDGSIDNSSEIINKYAEKYENITFIDEKENRGVIFARNKAIDVSTGEYILPLDADDTIEPTYIEKAVKILDENPKIGIVYCKAQFFGTKNGYWELPEFNKENFIFANCIFCTALFRKIDFYKAGKYKEEMNIGCEDWDLWLSFIELGLDTYRINEILFNYRQCEENTRTTKANQCYKDICMAVFKRHPKLYVNENCMKRIFKLDENNKYKKYRKLFNILLIVTIIETFFILIFLIRSSHG